MLYSTMIFDIDGTLTDSASAILHALHDALLSTTGNNYSYEELNFALGTPSHVALQKLAGDKWEEAGRIGQLYYMAELNNVSLFPGMEETIINLHKKGTRLGIVTSKTRAQLMRTFFNYSIYPYFKYIICEDDTPFHKPDPHPLLECINLFQTDPASTLFIGDTPADRECARHAGTAFGLAAWGCVNISAEKTDIVLTSPEDLVSLAL